MGEELIGKDLTQLCDLLVTRTMQLLKEMEQRSNASRIQELKKDVELIQAAIREKKANGHE
jgi:hypothetical protein